MVSGGGIEDETLEGPPGTEAAAKPPTLYAPRHVGLRAAVEPKDELDNKDFDMAAAVVVCDGVVGTGVAGASNHGWMPYDFLSATEVDRGWVP